LFKWDVGGEEQGFVEVVVDDHCVDGFGEEVCDSAFTGAGGAGHLDEELLRGRHGE